ncbi:MAG: B12-binding domain-containing protein [Acidimicrobiales bacterium]|nr:B12-binding domain-containing protein [Acidimicrobiales bacterium]
MSSNGLTLNQVAERLGVHYMTAYRYIKTGRLRAIQVNGQWRIDERDVRRLQNRSGPTRPRRSHRHAPGSVRKAYPIELAAALVQGDEAGAWVLLESRLASGMKPDAVYLEVLAPAMRHIGAQWEAGVLPVAGEHRATAVMQRLIARLGAQLRPRGRRRATVIIGAAPGDQHSLPVQLVADLLRINHVDVCDLGANCPPPAFADAAQAVDRLRAVGICATVAPNRRALRQTIDTVRGVTSVPVFIGGAGVDEVIARHVGADAYTATAVAVIDLVNELTGTSRR